MRDKMQKLIILAALAACCVAGPTLQQDDVKTSLPRPSPINPAVASDPKPSEKITVITDPKEVAKFKRESDNHPHEPVATHLTPTVAPAHHAEDHSHDGHHNHEDHHDHKDTHAHGEHHHRARREATSTLKIRRRRSTSATPAPVKSQGIPKSPKPLSTTAPPAPVKSQAIPKSPKPLSTTAPPASVKSQAIPTLKNRRRRTTPAPTATPVPVPAPQKHRQKRDDSNVQPASTDVHHAIAAPLKLTEAESHSGHVAQTASIHLPDAEQSSVPIRHQHIGALFHAAQAQEAASAVRQKHYPDLQGGHPATSSPLLAGASHTELNAGHPSSTPASHIDAKRDIPVPLVAKHQHPEESPKDNEKKDEEHLEKHTEEKKDEKHNDEKKDDIQVEDLSEKAPGNHHPQAHHQLAHSQEHHQQHDFHPQHPVQHTHEETQVPVFVPTSSSTAATTEHPVVRHHPVPVAELFARPKQQSEN